MPKFNDDYPDGPFSKKKGTIKIIGTNSNMELAKFISIYLQKQLTLTNIVYHKNTEIKVQILENIRGCSVYIIASGSVVDNRSVNDHLMEVLCLADACKRSDAKSICLIIPCFPYARSDKKDDGRCSISSSLITNLIVASGITRIIAVDLHSGQIQGFSNIPFDNLYCVNLFCNYIMEEKYNTNDYILVSPDMGGSKRVIEYAKRLKMPYAIMNKQRDYTKESVVDSSMLLSNVDYKGKTTIIIDDIIDSMNTIFKACEELRNHGLKKAIVLATHGIFSGNAIDYVDKNDFIEKVVITNSLPLDKKYKTYGVRYGVFNTGKIYVLDLSPLLSEVIYNLETDKSISRLFEWKKINE